MFVNNLAELVPPLNLPATQASKWRSPGFLGRWLAFAAVPLLLCQCGSFSGGVAATPPQAANIVVSVQEQKIALYGSTGKSSKSYPVSTSKFGLGDKPGTYSTPLGLHDVVAKVGHGSRSGTVYKGRSATGEVVAPNSPGRDPIVSRIMWLRGLESQNKNAYRRCIYIHGTADELNIGRPVSYGCVRMKSKDVIELFDRVGIGARVLIVEGKLPARMNIPAAGVPSQPPASQPPIYLDPRPNVPGSPAPLVTPPSNMQPALPPPTYETPILAQNDLSTGPAGYQAKTMPNGTVIYTPSASSSSTARLVLRSKRGASDGLR